MKRLGMIIVNYNTRDILRDCLNNLLKEPRENTGIVVVDNGSKDGSSEMVKKEFSNVILVETGNNGLAVGYNLGMKEVPDADYYLFMGSDAFPEPGVIDGVINYMVNDPTVGIATAKLILRNGALDMDAHRGFPTPWTALTHFTGADKIFPKSKLFNRYFMRWSDMEKPHDIDLCISHFMMVRKEVFEKVGGWDEDYFVYGEDVDLCWRTKKAGYKIFYLPQFRCLHYKGVSVGTRKESMDITRANSGTRALMRDESVRAMRLFYDKHMKSHYPTVINRLVILGITILARLRKK